MVDVAGNVGGAVSPVLQLAEWLAAPIWRQFKYLFNYKSNFDNLQEEVDKLKNIRDEIQRKVTAAERNVEEIKQNVKNWQKDVEKTITESEQLIQAKANNPRCFKGLCPNFITCYKQSKKAFKLKRDDIDPLFQQEKEFNQVSLPINPPEIWLRPKEDYLAFESRDSTVKNVWDALNDENVFMIGVYGMGGLGKTTLVEELSRKAEKDKLFEDIVFVEVSKFPDVKKIQTTIANKLGLKFENENESEMANKLYSRMKDKNILLILDNIWEPLELDRTVGIPCGADRGRNKLLFTTRNEGVLKRMGSTNNFGMGFLNDDEAWTLFIKMAGNVIQTHELRSLPNDVCKECGGLPIVICTIAKTLKDRSYPSDWKVALQELREPSPTEFSGFLEKEYKNIALSYKYLRDDELKKTFLISSLMKNNASISDLLRHVLCLDILKGANLKMEDARDRLVKLIHELKDACLLLNGFESERFAMHDVIRDVAFTIAYKDHHVFTTRNDVEREWKDKEKLKKCTKIFLPGNNTIISQLWPNDMDCPNVEYFYMTDVWNSSFEIPEDFFIVMPKLRVLNLVGLQQLSLPSSIHHLTNLQTLCLDNSHIEGIPVIGKLNKLKILSLRYSYIKAFPMEIGQLTQLRLLDLSCCRQLNVIAPNVISKLSQLEELYLKKCSIQWKIEVLEELKLLSKLTSLELDIIDDKVLPKEFFSKELIRYKISVGNWQYQNPIIDEQKCLRILKLKFNPTIYLEELDGINNIQLLWLAEYLDDKGKDDLEHSTFNLQYNEITPLFNKKVIFPDLKILVLKNIISRKIWDCQLPSSSFENLKQLILWRCTKIKFMFPYTITKNLQQLQYLEIKDCIDLEEIVATEEITEAAVSFVFPEVTFLKLENLPELATFYPRIHTLGCPKLKWLELKGCDKFKMLNSEPNSLCLDHKISHDLEVLKLTGKSTVISWSRKNKALKISGDKLAYIPLPLQRFQSLEEVQLRDCEYKEIKSISNLPNLNVLHVWECSKLVSPVVSGCSELVNLATPSIARSLVPLKELSISNCGMLTEILENERNATTMEIVFEKLHELSLYRLECLTCFSSGNHSFNFPSLEKLIIIGCPNMNTFSGEISSVSGFTLQSNEITPFFNEKVLFHDLKVLELKNISPEKIWDSQPSTSSYQNLTHLTLFECDKIKYVFPLSIAKSLQQLQHLELMSCEILERIVTPEEGTEAVVNFSFPQVTKVKLQYLPEFTDFYIGIHTSEWPKLKELVVKDCPKFKMLTSEPNSLCLDQQINFNLEVFELYDGGTNICWQSQSKTLTIERDISTNILLQLLQRFENVRELQLSWSQTKDIKSLCDLPNLEILEVHYCYRLMSLLPFSGSFQNLKVFKVSSCKGLIMKLITPSVARSLVQLRELSISNCEMLTEIVENEGDAATCTEIVFNNLSKLSLKLLKSLTCFCSRNYSFSFPSLEELKIDNCFNLEIFCQGSLCTPKLDKVIYKFKNENVRKVEIGDNDLNTTIQQEHKKQVGSSWKELTLSGRNIKRTLQGEFQENFGKIETLRLIKDDHAYIPIHMLLKFVDLEELILKVSSYEEIFSYEEGEEHVGALLKLKVLQLQGLFNLKCIWKQDFQFKSILQNLHFLDVEHCHNLITLLPSSSSFKNLIALEAKYCHGMQNLMTSSTAKSLACLKKLSIEACEKMIEVLASEGDTEKNEIVFKRLKELCLLNLENLACFYYGNYTLKFPFLESLVVDKCSKMKTFSREGVNMPRLQRVNGINCSNDLNYVTTQLQNDCSKLWERFPFPW